jgi:Rrf2 family protein
VKLINRNTNYAIRSLVYIAEIQKIVTVSELIKYLRIPKALLRKIMQILSRRNILKSMRGKNGGFSLNKSPAKIYVMDIAKIFQGDIEPVNCIFRGSACSNIRHCLIKDKGKKIEKDIAYWLKSISILSLVHCAKSGKV